MHSFEAAPSSKSHKEKLIASVFAFKWRKRKIHGAFFCKKIAHNFFDKCLFLARLFGWRHQQSALPIYDKKLA